MKKTVLLAALALGAATMANGQATLTQSWSLTCPIGASNARSGVGTHGKFYVIEQNKGVHVYDTNGEVELIPNATAWVSINADDAGHVYFRNDKTGWAGKTWDGSYYAADAQFCVYDAVAGEMVAENVPLTGVADGTRFDALPHVFGDMTAGAFNMVLPISTVRTFYEVAFPSLTGTPKGYYSEAPVTYYNAGALKTANSTTALTQQYDANHLAVILNASSAESYKAENKGNAIGIFEKTAPGQYTFKGFADTPCRSGVSGFHIFDCKGDKYIVYPTGQTSAVAQASADGFAVAPLTVVDTPDCSTSQPLALNYASIELGETFPRYFNVEAVAGNETIFNIYLYSPGKIMSVYNLNLSALYPGEDPNPGEDPDPNPGEDPDPNPGEDPDPNPGEDPGVDPGEDYTIDYTFETTWRNDMPSTTATDMRQGVGVNGKMYIANSQYSADGNGWIEVWGPEGKEGEIKAEGGIGGTNITADEAGNILVRKSKFPGSFAYANFDAIIIAPDGTQTPITFNKELFNEGEAGISTRQDFWGHIKGDMLSEEGGVLTFGTSGGGHIDIKIANGVHVGGETTRSAYYADTNFPHTTTALFHHYSFLDQDAVLYQAGPNDPIQYAKREPIEGTYKWFIRGQFKTPGHNNTVGCALFQLHGDIYIVYSRGSNRADGIVIAKATLDKGSLKVVPQGPETDSNVIYSNYAEMAGDNTKYNGGQYNHFNVEITDDGNSAHIYQFSPGCFNAMHTFTANKIYSGVETVITDDAAQAAEDCAPVYYNMQGVRVANPANGLYIEVRGKSSSKVYIR